MIGLRAAAVLGLAVGAFLGASVMFGPAYFIGKRAERSAAAAEAVANTVRVLKERGNADAEISAITDVRKLCDYFGLRGDDNTECVRRLEETNAVRNNGGDDSHR